jgi:HK97 family phage prohead protease
MNFDRQKEFKLHTLFTKTISNNDNVLRIKGLANTCSQDRNGDIIPIETWTESALKNYIKNPIVLAYHDHKRPIGKVIKHSITEEGIEIVAEISDTDKDIVRLIKDGVLKSFSIGFYILDAKPKSNDDGWVITQLELHEISVVSIPANQDSIFSVSKSFGPDKKGLKEFKKSFGKISKDNTHKDYLGDKSNVVNIKAKCPECDDNKIIDVECRSCGSFEFTNMIHMGEVVEDFYKCSDCGLNIPWTNCSKHWTPVFIASDKFKYVPVNGGDGSIQIDKKDNKTVNRDSIVKTTPDEDSDVQSEKKFWGKKLIIAAWSFEIVAAFIGLMIAWAQGFETYIAYQEQNNGVFPISKFFDIFIAALPFIMVAGVELLKIPFAYLVYINTNKVVRIVFSIVLVGVTFITFETLFTGFERQFNNTTAKVQILKNQMEYASIELIQKKKEISQLKNVNVNDIYQTYIDNREKAQNEYFGDVAILKKRLDQNINLDPDNVQLHLTIEQLQRDINQFKSDRGEEVEVFEKNIVSQRDSIINTKMKKEENLEDLIKKEKSLQQSLFIRKNQLGLFSGLSQDIQDYQAKIIFTRDEISKVSKLVDKYTTRIQIINDKLTKGVLKIRNQFSEKIDSISKHITKLKSDDINGKKGVRKVLIDSINVEISKREQKYLNDLEKIDEWRITQEQGLKTKKNLISSMDAHTISLKERINDLSNRINEAVVNTQVYRIAQNYFGKEKAVDITKEEVTFIATIWFGSLAGIVSSMGIFLAMGGFILIHHKDEEKENNNENIFSKSILLLLNALKNKIIKPQIIEKIIKEEVPVEVIKEVPVDRVVIKEVEKIVIKEVEVEKIVIKEVPIIKRITKYLTRYTNDPNLLES